MIEKDDQLKIRLFSNPAKNFDCDIYIQKDDMIAESLVFRKRKERYENCNPICTTERNNAQILMDDLWSAGLRPTEGSGSAGSLAATQKHLEDMRTIAFYKIGIKNDRQKM